MAEAPGARWVSRAGAACRSWARVKARGSANRAPGPRIPPAQATGNVFQARAGVATAKRWVEFERLAAKVLGELHPQARVVWTDRIYGHDSRIRQAATTNQIIHARVRTQASTIRIVCVGEKPSEPSTQPAPGR